LGYNQEPAELREVIVERLARLYGWYVLSDDLVFLPGVVTGFNLACQAVASPGEAVLVQPPVYPPILHSAPNGRLLRLEAPLSRRTGDRYEVDFDRFEATIDERAKVFLLCNPHNPVGRVFEQQELEEMGDICLRHNLVVCSDEIHCDLVFRGHHHVPIASLSPELANHTITLMAPSKTFNIAGLQCSFAVIQNPDLRARFENARRGLVSHVNLMGFTAALAAYEQGQHWLEQMLAYVEENRNLVCGFVNSQLNGVEVFRPEGTYLAWLDCRNAKIPGNAFQFFLKEAQVALNDGEAFGDRGEGFVRLNFGCARSTLVEALERIRTALDKIAP
jgi:cystathionine beta-lyase